MTALPRRASRASCTYNLGARRPEDRILWDVSHQCYPHKLLTGRKDRFHTLRQKDGLSGFSNKWESEYDAYLMGHAGTAASAALPPAFRMRRPASLASGCDVQQTPCMQRTGDLLLVNCSGAVASWIAAIIFVSRLAFLRRMPCMIGRFWAKKTFFEIDLFIAIEDALTPECV